MDERYKISVLLDIYGSLLTEKQLDLMNLYFNQDLSLSEIAEVNSTSRQAIHDVIKRCQKLLNNYEDKLKVFDKIESENKIKEVVNKKIDFILGNLDSVDIKKELLDIKNVMFNKID